MASSILFPTCAITLALLFLFPVATFASTIYDVDGEALENNGAYHIVTWPRIGSGGLFVEPINHHSLPCPLFIKEKPYSQGSPVTISSPFKIGILKTGFRLSLYFDNVPTDCNKPLRWWVTKGDENNNHRYVIVGVDSDQFKNTYYFKIEEANNYDSNEGKYVYNIKFCHVSESRIFATVSNVDEECNDVGFIDGKLGITSEPFNFVFMKNAALQLAA